MFKYIVKYNIMADKFNKFKDSGLTGLVNIGNTCYLNFVYNYYLIRMN